MLRLGLLLLLCHRAIASPAADTIPQPRTGGNVLGALIFFSYIVAALAFSILIVNDIARGTYGDALRTREGATTKRNDHRPESATIIGTKRNSGGIRKEVRIIYPVLALASFSVLSWNMLNFLIVSYSAWAKTHGVQQTVAVADLAHPHRYFLYIWQWSTESNLFQTFAEDLLASQSTWNHVRIALLYSYLWNLWMSFIGRQADIRHLWAYFVLGQILPTSLSQNLFCSALVLTPARLHNQLRSMILTRVVVTAGYAVLLLVMPHTVYTVWFLPTLFALRAMLFAPFFVDMYDDAGTVPQVRDQTLEVSKFNTRCLALFSMWGAYSLLFSGEQYPKPDEALETNYASSALTEDLVLGVGSGVLFALTSFA